MTYPETLLDHYRNPRHRGELSDATHRYADRNVLCGDEVEMQFRVEGGLVQAAAWDGVGCVYCVAAASHVCDAMIGRPVTELVAADDVEAALGVVVPTGRKGCISLPVDGARKALS